MNETLNYEECKDCFKLTENVQSVLLYGNHAMSDPLFSVFIPTFQRSDLFAEALASVLKQEPVDFPWEIVVVDNEPYDGNSNDTERLIREIGDSRIVYYRNTIHMSPGDNFNRGIFLSDGQWVMMLHDDDILMPNALKNMASAVCFLERYSNKPVGAICTEYIQFAYDPQNPQKAQRYIADTTNAYRTKPMSHKLYKLTRLHPYFNTHIGASVPSNGTTFRRDAVLNVGGFNDSFGISADLILCYCIEKNWAVYRTREPYGLYRWGANTMVRLESSYLTIKAGYNFREYIYRKNIFSKLYGFIFRSAQYSDFRDIVLQQREYVTHIRVSASSYADIYNKEPSRLISFIYNYFIKKPYHVWKLLETFHISVVFDSAGIRIGKKIQKKIANVLKEAKMRFLPPSSRSFHNGLKTVIESQNVMAKKLNELQREVITLKKKEENLFWLNVAQPDEPFGDTQRRVFKCMGKASGLVGDVQAVMLDIIKFFDRFCTKHNLSYWLWGGTLLGAIRHDGFIPWDDDADFGMLRKDFEKFKALLQEEISQYQLVDYYECGVTTYRCGRFAKLRNVNCPADIYIDVFVFDYDDSINEFEAQAFYYARRRQLHKIIYEYCKENGVKSENAPIKDERDKENLDKLFDEFIKEHLIPETDYIQWSLELFLAPYIRLWHKEDFFPLKRINFEGVGLYAPRNAEKIATMMYGDIYSLSDDMYSNYHSNVFGYTGKEEEIHRFISEELGQETL